MSEGTNGRGTKTATFQMRINPEVKRRAEELYASYGLTLTDTVSVARVFSARQDYIRALFGDL